MIVSNTTTNFAINILILLYGLTSNNLIVPLLNSSLTIAPEISTTVSIINNPYPDSKKTVSSIPLALFSSNIFLSFSITYLLFAKSAFAF